MPVPIAQLGEAINVVLGHMDAALDSSPSCLICTFSACTCGGHRTVPVLLALPSEPWITALGPTWAPLPITSTRRGKLHFFTFFYLHIVHFREFFCHFRLLGLALRLSRSCLFRCRREIFATLEAGTCARSRALVLYVLFSRGISASRSRELVVCIPHSFCFLILTRRCGA